MKNVVKVLMVAVLISSVGAQAGSGKVFTTWFKIKTALAAASTAYGSYLLFTRGEEVKKHIARGQEEIRKTAIAMQSNPYAVLGTSALFFGPMAAGAAVQSKFAKSLKGRMKPWVSVVGTTGAATGLYLANLKYFRK